MPDDIDNKAKEILRSNDKGGFTVPTGGLYPYQWNWDSMFVALGFATFDRSRACQEIETLFEAQWSDGFVPHIVFRREDPDYFPGPSVWQAGETLPTSGITQPPVAASVVYKLWSEADDDSIRGRLAALFPKVLAWHRWFHSCRIPQGIDAIVITHPWESGRDNSPEWDSPASAIDVSEVEPYTRRDLQHADPHMRPTKLDYDRYIALVEYGRGTGWDQKKIATEGPFRVADVGMTMILLRATRDLLALAKALARNDDRPQIEGYLRQLETGVDYLWDDKHQTFCSRDTVNGQHSGMVTSASFLYAYADAGNEEQRKQMLSHWERISANAEYMLPSHDPDNVHFDHMRYWKGPVWMVVNYMLAQGFAEQGMPEAADRIKADSRRLIEGFGFNEAFSPKTGAGTGGSDFSWTAAMWLAWCGQDT
ncbi:MAG: hypothetical protein QNJ05_10360 [Woeseiaceae bacterium]|nr:hypothetical protein [Woeseiaceae bacterium]